MPGTQIIEESLPTPSLVALQRIVQRLERERPPHPTERAPHQVEDGGSSVAWNLYRNDLVATCVVKGTAGAVISPHYHPDQTLWLIVFEGAMRVEFDAEEVILRAGDGVEISPGTRHCIHYIENTRLIAVSVPPAPEFPDVS